MNKRILLILCVLLICCSIVAYGGDMLATNFNIKVNNSKVSIKNNLTEIKFNCSNSYEATQPLWVDCSPLIKNATSQTTKSMEELTKMFSMYAKMFNGTTPETYAKLLTNYTLMNKSYSECVTNLDTAAPFENRYTLCAQSLSECNAKKECKKDNTGLMIILVIAAAGVGFVLGKKSKGRSTEIDNIYNG